MPRMKTTWIACFLCYFIGLISDTHVLEILFRYTLSRAFSFVIASAYLESDVALLETGGSGHAQGMS